MRTSLRRGLAASATAAVIGSLLVVGAPMASAFDAGPLVSVLNNNTGTINGTNFDAVRFTAPAPCDVAATRHTVKITGVVATNPANQSLADAWAGDLLYSPSSVGLPGPLTTISNGSWQQIADAFGQQLVPGTYSMILQCQNNLGTTIFEQWSGAVTFTSPTAWVGQAAALVATTTTVTADPQPVTAGQNVTLTATVGESDPGTPTGTVEFFRDATSIGSAPVDGSGVATLVTPLPAGSFSINATYSGDATFATSSGTRAGSFVVDAAPAAVTDITLGVSPTSGPSFQAVTLTGTVTNVTTPATVPTGQCKFFDVANLLATVPVNASGVCAFTSATFGGAGHVFTADYVPSDTALFNADSSNQVTADYDAVEFVPDDQTIIVTVPRGTLTIFTPYTPENPLNLGDMVLAADGSSFSASAAFNKVTITDTRAGNPGWAAALNRSDFVRTDPATPAGITIPAQYSGFENVAPSYIAGNAIQAGDVVTTDIPANSPGYVPGPVTFASAGAGNGTGTVDILADFVLEGVPTSTEPGTYQATVTFTIG